jgi:PAS domain S-box-containing protein
MLIELADLHRAIANDEIIPHFQPIVELSTGRLSGFEVLARWNHPLHGAFLPSNMIDLAEVYGLIDEIAQQVFSKAFSTASALTQQPRLSVNVSPSQLGLLNLPRFISEISGKSGFPLDRLTIEMTETALLNDLSRSQAIAHELKDLGCRLSLDDFGTGYSSLAHLQALPFDEIKIDRAFVSQMTNKRESRKIVAAIIGLTHSLGLDTVAEGIETQEQADMLLSLGSELGQGWRYGRPAPFHSVHAMVAQLPRPASAKVPLPGDAAAISSLEAFPTQRLSQLQAIYDGAPVGLCFLDCNLRYVSLNKKLSDMNGRSVAEHLGKTVHQIAPELYPNIESFLQRALHGEAILGVELARPRLGANEGGWILCSYQPAFDEANEVIGVSVSAMDVTEHKLAQAELGESEFVQCHLGLLNGQVPWMMDNDGNTLQLNPKMVGATPGSKTLTRSFDWLDALHPSDLKTTIRKMKKALRTGEPIDIEYRVRTTDGEWRWMRSHGSPRVGPHGEINRWYGSVEDIHEKKCEADRGRKSKSKMQALLKAASSPDPLGATLIDPAPTAHTAVVSIRGSERRRTA